MASIDVPDGWSLPNLLLTGAGAVILFFITIGVKDIRLKIAQIPDMRIQIALLEATIRELNLRIEYLTKELEKLRELKSSFPRS